MSTEEPLAHATEEFMLVLESDTCSVPRLGDWVIDRSYGF